MAREMSDPESRAGDPDDLGRLRVAVVHDWLTGMRGGEKVLEAILDRFPRAEIFTLFHFPGSVSRAIETRVIHTSSLQSVASRSADYRHWLPLFPWAVGRWSLDGYDLVISSSHCVAKGVRTTAPHVCYCHTPMRYVWDRFDDYFPPSKPLVRLAGSTIAPWLRRWDRSTSDRVDRFVANSAFVRDRIRGCYGVEASVVHPFVDDSFLSGELNEQREDLLVAVSALVPYKRIDVALEAARNAGKKIVVVGDGPMRGELERRFGKEPFVGRVDDETLRSIVSRAGAFLLPGVEDFGIAPVEAMALGTPVVAVRAGGACETVVEGSTGTFFDGSVRDLVRAVESVFGRRWDRGAMRRHASLFSKRRFAAGLESAVREAMGIGT